MHIKEMGIFQKIHRYNPSTIRQEKRGYTLPIMAGTLIVFFLLMYLSLFIMRRESLNHLKTTTSVILSSSAAILSRHIS